ncbi:ABC transporter ATP-binding protein [Niallia oryzisoli]|uniref:ABC transporter ATP-binding protein n=1 Tax=Niallia oryzisoli TaxID=1737571 RepID=UPI0037355352
MSLLKVEALNKSYGSLHILRDVSFEVQPGERHVFIGPNGAGKTTLFNSITGALPISSGTIKIEEETISDLPEHKRVSHGMSRTFQKNNLFEEMTIEENLQMALLYGKSYRFQFLKPLFRYREIDREVNKLLEEWDIEDRRHVLVKNLSYGEQRLLEMLLAFASKPRLLLLDEPTSGMSPAETKQTIQVIQGLPKTMTLLIVEHDMEVVFSIADRITVLHHGEVYLSGKPEEIRGHEKVREIYFGGGAKRDS